MAEDADYSPGAWQGHDFDSARKAYDANAGRAYTAAATTGVRAADLVPGRIRTESMSPLVVMVDVTGSMGTWPAVIFSKLPYLDIEGREYLGPDMEISFAANGDFQDKYPLQVRGFNSGVALKDELAKLLVEKGGSGPVSGQEAYEIGALFYASNVDMPNAVKPIFIFVADEQPHQVVTRAHAEAFAKVRLTQDMTVDEVFAALKALYSVYLVHKAYSPESRQEWVRLLGEERIADLQEPERVVDVIFGILAREAGRVDYFHKEIEGRQNPGQVATVYRALNTVHRIAVDEPKALPGPGKSTLHKPTGGKPSKGLL